MACRGDIQDLVYSLFGGSPSRNTLDLSSICRKKICHGGLVDHWSSAAGLGLASCVSRANEDKGQDRYMTRVQVITQEKCESILSNSIMESIDTMYCI